MTGWRMFRRSVDTILGNLGAAIQVSAILFLLTVLAGTPMLERAMFYQRGFLFLPGQFVWWMWGAAVLLSVVPTLWIAVGWHRFVLRGDRPWIILPPFRPGRVWHYGLRCFGMMLVMALVGAAIAIVASMLSGIIALIFGGSERERFAGIFGVTFAVLLAPGAVLWLYYWLRFSPVVVAAAVDETCDISRALEMTERFRRAIFVLALLIVGFALLFEVIKQGLVLAGMASGIYGAISLWFITMLNVGVLTTIYELGSAPRITEVTLPTGSAQA